MWGKWGKVKATTRMRKRVKKGVKGVFCKKYRER